MIRWVKFFLFTLMLTLPTIAYSDLQPHVPAFAKALKIRLGVDAERLLESKLGKGKATLGGHSNSGRVWVYRNGLELYSDAFDRIGNNLILDTLAFSGWKGRLGDTKELGALGVGVWSNLRIGMTPKECLSSLSKELPNFIRSKDRLVWEQNLPGMRNGKPGTFSYKTSLEFADGRLKSLLLEGGFIEK